MNKQGTPRWKLVSFFSTFFGENESGQVNKRMANKKQRG